MTGLQKTWALLLVSTFFIAGGCSQKQEVPAKAKDPQISLSCIGVMPVVSSVDYDTEDSFSDVKTTEGRC